MSDAELKANQTKPDIVINGKVYPMWQQFVHQKEEWIGGLLQDLDDDPMLGGQPAPPTQITDIVLRENGARAACFEVIGEDYSCGFSTTVGGVGRPIGNALTLYGYGSYKFSIIRRAER